MSTRQELLNLLDQHPEPKTLNDVLTWADVDDDSMTQALDQELESDYSNLNSKREAMGYAWDAGFIAGLHAMHRVLRSPRPVHRPSDHHNVSSPTLNRS